MKKKKISLGMYGTAIVSKMSLVILTLLTTAMINRCLGVVLKGEYAYINNWVSILVTVFSLGVGHTYSTYHRRYGKEALGTFVTLALARSLAVAIIAAVAWIVRADYDVRWMLLITTFAVLKSNILYIAAIEDVRKRDINNIFYKVLYTLIIFVAFVNQIQSLELMLGLLIVDEVITVGGTFLKYKLRPSFKFLHEQAEDKKGRLKILFGIYTLGFISMLMFLMINLNYNLDVIMLKQMTNDYNVGLYSVGVNLANLLFLVPDAFKDVLFHKTAKEDSIRDIVASIKVNILIDLVLIGGFAVVGKWFIELMYGSEFIGSYPVTLVLFAGSLSMVIYKMVHPLYISKGRQKTVFFILLASVILNAVANLILIPMMGIMGAAIASVVSYTACSIIFLMVFCREYGLKVHKVFLIQKDDIRTVKELIMRKGLRAKTGSR